MVCVMLSILSCDSINTKLVLLVMGFCPVKLLNQVCSVCMCPPPRILIPSIVIWTHYDWLTLKPAYCFFKNVLLRYILHVIKNVQWLLACLIL